MQPRAGNTQGRHKFPKKIRLSSPKLVDELFRHSCFLTAPPIKVIYREAKLPEDEPLQVLISVPKKVFPKATDRNRIKRLLREGVRKQVHQLRQQLKIDGKSLSLGILYIGRNMPEFSDISANLQRIFNQLRQIHENHPSTDIRPDDIAD